MGRAVYYAGRAGVAVLPSGTIVDKGLDIARCLPGFVGLYFGDASCSQPVCVTSPSYPSPTACQVTEPWKTDAPPLVRAVTHAHEGPLYFQDATNFSGGGCQPASKIGSYAPANGYDLGEPVSLEEFEPAI